MAKIVSPWSLHQRNAGRQPPPPVRRGRTWLPPLVVGSLIAGLVGAQIAPTAGCTIKGNISQSGERIYHMPGQQYYTRTVIDPDAGERWFCSEQEASAAGWRKARV